MHLQVRVGSFSMIDSFRGKISLSDKRHSSVKVTLVVQFERSSIHLHKTQLLRRRHTLLKEIEKTTGLGLLHNASNSILALCAKFLVTWRHNT